MDCQLYQQDRLNLNMSDTLDTSPDQKMKIINFLSSTQRDYANNAAQLPDEK